MENIKDIQKVYDDIQMALSECKKTKSYLYIFTKAVSYVKLSRFVEEILQKIKSKNIRLVKL